LLCQMMFLLRQVPYYTPALLSSIFGLFGLVRRDVTLIWSFLAGQLTVCFRRPVLNLPISNVVEYRKLRLQAWPKDHNTKRPEKRYNYAKLKQQQPQIV
jgi:hypothetical protein